MGLLEVILRGQPHLSSFEVAFGEELSPHISEPLAKAVVHDIGRDEGHEARLLAFFHHHKFLETLHR